MTTVADLQVQLGLTGLGPTVAGLGQVDQGIAQVARTGAGASIDADRLFGGLDKLGSAMLAGGGALAVGLGLAAKGAADLEQSVANVASIAPQIDRNGVFNALNEMQTHVAQSATQLGASLYNIFSSIDVDQAGALKLTEMFGKGAVAAQTDAQTFGTAILGVMNAYGQGVQGAAHDTDVFFNTVKLGVVTGPELASSLGLVTQGAKSAGVNIDELGGMIAGVTKEGGPAAQNINNLSNYLTKFTTKQAQADLRALGIATTDQSGAFRDQLAILTDLKTKLDGMSQSQRAATLNKLFPDLQARTGVQTLLSELDFVKRAVDENAQSAGAAEKAYATMADTAASKFAILKNTASRDLADIGVLLLPDAEAGAEKIEHLFNAFEQLDPEVQRNIVHAAEWTAGILILGGGALKAASAVYDLYKAVAAVSGALRLGSAVNVVATAARAAAPAIAEVAAVTVVAGAAAVGLVYGVSKAADALDQGHQRMQDFNQSVTAAAFAQEHGATATNGAVDGFVRYLQATNATIKSTDDLASAWNRYVGTISIAGQSTSAFTLALTAAQQALLPVNRYFGEGLIAGNRFNDTLFGLTSGAVAVGNTLPPLGFGLGQAALAFAASMTAADDYNRALSEAEAQGYVTTRSLGATATGALAAADAFASVHPPITTTALGLRDIDIYGTGAQTALNDDANAAGAAALAFDKATTALAGYQKQGSQLKGEKDILQADFDELVKKRDGTPLSDADQKKLADDQAQLADLNTRASGGNLSATQKQHMADLQAEIAGLEKLRTQRKLTAAEEKKLADDRAALADLQAKAGPGTLTAAEEQRRKDLQAEIAALEAKVKAGVPLTPAEQARLEDDAGKINWLNGQIGVNQADTRTAASTAVAAQQQAAAASARSTQAQAVAQAAQAAAAAGRGLAIQAPPQQKPPVGSFFGQQPIDTSGVSGYDEFGRPYGPAKTPQVSPYDEFGQPYEGTKTAQASAYDEFGQLLNQAISAAAQPRTIIFQIDQINGLDADEAGRRFGAAAAAQFADLVQGGGSGTVAGIH